LIQHIIDFPESARVDRIIPKKKIYDKAAVINRVKNAFIKEVEQIRWLYKLSPETINIPASKSVQEIQVFHIRLREQGEIEEVLVQIDKSIPSPILFMLQFEEQIRYVACFKRPSQAGRAKWVTSEYFGTNWIQEQAGHKSLPVTLTIESLYFQFLKWIIPIEIRDNEELSGLVQRAELLRMKECAGERLSSRLQKEKQFNRKVEINTELRTIRGEIDELLLSTNSRT
jgi:hypothetical protein